MGARHLGVASELEYVQQIPRTPTRKRSEKIDDIVATIEGKWRLGLQTRGLKYSPSAQKKELANQIYDSIKFLYWKAEKALEDTLAEFDERAQTTVFDERLALLRDLLDREKSAVLRTKNEKYKPTALAQRLRHADDDDSDVAALVSSDSISGCSPNETHFTTVNESLTHTNFTSAYESLNHTNFASANSSPAASTSAEDEIESFSSAPQSPSKLAQERRTEARSAKRLSETSERDDIVFPAKFSRLSNGNRSTDSFETPAEVADAAFDCSGTTLVSSFPSIFTSQQAGNEGIVTGYTSFTTNATTEPETGDEPKVDSEQKVPVEGPSLSSSSDPYSFGTSLNPSDIECCSWQDASEELSSPVVAMKHSTPVQHQVGDLWKQGLFIEEPWPNNKGTLPSFRVRHESIRLMIANYPGLPPTVANDTIAPFIEDIREVDDFEQFWDSASKHGLKLPPNRNSKMWAAATKENGFENISLKASTSFNHTNIGALFTLKLEPMTWERPSRFQRRFGHDRFLFVEFPNIDNLPTHIKEQRGNIREGFRRWLSEPKTFLGRTWESIMIVDVKRRETRNESAAGHRVTLFATRGYELEPISLEEVINWFIPLKKNLQQPFCKAFARLELGFSRATPTYVFKPSQIREVDDILGDETPEASEYDDDDPQYAAEFGTGPFQRQVMNDGCAVMSQGAAREIWRAMGQTGPIPSVFQARIGGWKGLWIRGASAEAGPRDNEIWIEVSKSQKKFERPDEDFVDDTFDPIRLSFEVLNYSRPPTSASLHTSFIPILQDRGVPQEALETVVLDFLEYSRQEILYNLDHKDRLRSWLRTQFEGEQRPHDDAIQWYAGLPRLLQDKIVLLLESGFLPKKLPYLGNLFHLLLDSHFRKLTRNLRIPLPRSTMVYGIADPTGALLPGEIHLAFSGSFRAEDLNAGEEECFQFLNDRAVLVARHPALRNSDIQKVRAVYKMELSHIVDVVVFPSRGKFPLASKLQGGDYDGDTFWVCFEPSLVDSFKNAPAPRNLPGPENFGIRVDRRKLGDLVTNEKSLGLPLRRFVDEAFKFRCQPSYLGMVTNYHGNLAYKEDSINSDGVKDLASLHDHLIDSKKNGYTFDENMWRHFKEKHHALPNKPPEEPRYKAAMKEALEQNLGSGRRTETQPKHILDKIYFNVVFKHTRETLRRVKEVCADNEPGISDPDLENPYTSFLTRIDEEDLDIRGPIQDELRKLRSRLCAIRERWKQLWTNNEQVQKRYFDILDECFQMYTDIDPLNRDCAVIREWTVQDANNRPTTWELLKASAFFVECGAQDKLVFPIAGRQLAYLKADAAGDARLVHRDIYRTSKPKKVRKWREEAQMVGRAGSGRGADTLPEPGPESPALAFSDGDGDDCEETSQYFDAMDEAFA